MLGVGSALGLKNLVTVGHEIVGEEGARRRVIFDQEDGGGGLVHGTPEPELLRFHPPPSKRFEISRLATAQIAGRDARAFARRAHSLGPRIRPARAFAPPAH